MVKKTTKKPVANKDQDLTKQVDKVLAEIKEFTTTANRRYQSLDDTTKKKLAVGVGLLATMAAGALLIKKKKK